MALSEQVNAISAAFTGGLRRILANKLVAAYIFGAAAFPDTENTGDIDFHVILSTELTASERDALEELHREIARQFPPLGGEMDGHYILLQDVHRQTPPRSQMWQRAADTAWALHREHIRAGRYITLHGPNPRDLYPPATWSEIEAALYSELDYVEQHLSDYPDYCILNLCRLIYSFETKVVVISKTAAAEWAHKHLPQWQAHIGLARKSYAGKATAHDRQFMLAEVAQFYEFARSRIEEATHRREGE
ncbi:MAG: aminoglycoside adenylyltransferase domain-containing protein [Chloroflexota bacterium]